MDSKFIGLCPQGFESPRCRLMLGFSAQSVDSLPGTTLLRGGRASRFHHKLSAWPTSNCASASLAQLAEHALRKRMVVGSIPTGGSLFFLDRGEEA